MGFEKNAMGTIKSAGGIQLFESVQSTQNATQEVAGLMSPEDKTKLDSIKLTGTQSMPYATQDMAGLMSPDDKAKLDNISYATVNAAGLMTPEDKIKLDNMQTAQPATQYMAGLMSPEDKYKLDNIQFATQDTAGLMTPEDKFKLDNMQDMTVYATQEQAGLMSPEDKFKLDGIQFATTEFAGLMTPEDKAKLDDIQQTTENATTETAGLMSPEDKAKLDNLQPTQYATTETAGLMPPEDKAKLDGISYATEEYAGLMLPEDKIKLNSIKLDDLDSFQDLTGHIYFGHNTLKDFGIEDVTLKDGTISIAGNQITPLTAASPLATDKLVGIIDMKNLPASAIERCVVVKDDNARFALTQNDVQKGDTVKVMSPDPPVMYMVVDDTKLNSSAGYEVYTAGNAVTATKVVATVPAGGSFELVRGRMADNDFARIRMYGSSDAGELEIATGDNGTEPIIARQYSGGDATDANAFKQVAREAYLLDSAGNTSFPGDTSIGSGSNKVTINGTTGNITTGGSMSAGGSVSAGTNISAGGNVSAGGTAVIGSGSNQVTINGNNGNITTPGGVSAGGNISTGGNISAGGGAVIGSGSNKVTIDGSTGNISAGGNVSAGGTAVIGSGSNQVTINGNNGNITTPGGVSAGGNISTGGNISAGGGAVIGSGSNKVTIDGSTGNISAGGNVSAGGTAVIGSGSNQVTINGNNGNITTPGGVSAGGNISTGGNISAGGGAVIGSGSNKVTIDGSTGNISAGGNVSAGGTVVVGSGSNTVKIDGSTGSVIIGGGNNQVKIDGATGNITTGTGGGSGGAGNTSMSINISGNAGSTTKLKTPRKINGTAFDGTADITTNAWGTARNVYIADSAGANTGAAVSVNGSGNATLKLPATIKGNLNGKSTLVQVDSETAGVAVAKGQVVRVTDTGALTANDMLKMVRAAGTSADIATLAAKKLTMQEVFYNWGRISCISNTGADQNMNTDDQTKARASYYYDNSSESIVNTYNSNSFAGFLSNETYSPNYTLKYQLKGLDGDDDALFFICGFMTDKNGKFHTLSVRRVGGDQEGHRAKLAICYDVYTAWDTLIQSGGLVLAELNTMATTTWLNATVVCETQKTSSQIIAKTSDKNSTSLSYTLTWTLPSSKPSTWTQEQYDNIKHMMTTDSNIGFATQSNPCAFTILDQSGTVTAITIYDITTGKKLTYMNGVKQSESDGGTAMTPGCFLYSQLTKKLFFVKNLNTIIPLELGGGLGTSYVVESNYTLQNWYRKYSDGWIEQGGFEAILSNGTKMITYPAPFSTYISEAMVSIGDSGSATSLTPVGTPYTITPAYNGTVSAHTHLILGIRGETNASIVSWYACGR